MIIYNKKRMGIFIDPIIAEQLNIKNRQTCDDDLFDYAFRLSTEFGLHCCQVEKIIRG